ncbi:hypothetical protein GCM10017673_38720 [Streptosporangium violaceochromogenes]|nr:hypothetical protein GCM10017673_38720 [Streptosporangium violaceochromogenes]
MGANRLFPPESEVTDPFTDLHCPECGTPFPGTVGVGERMLTRCCDAEACKGAGDGDCGCVQECYHCPRRVLLSQARRNAEGNVACGRCAPVVVPEAARTAGWAELTAYLAELDGAGRL